MARKKKCDDCPVKELDDAFKDTTLDIWRRVLAVRAERFKFDNLLTAFYRAMRFKDAPPEALTVYQHGIVNVYWGEYNLHRDKKSFDDEQRRKANGQ